MGGEGRDDEKVSATLSPKERHERTKQITKMIVEVLPKREPLDHVVLACASIIAASVAALPRELHERAVKKIVRYIAARSKEILQRAKH